jgi:hypothetical protein
MFQLFERSAPKRKRQRQRKSREPRIRNAMVSLVTGIVVGVVGHWIYAEMDELKTESSQIRPAMVSIDFVNEAIPLVAAVYLAEPDPARAWSSASALLESIRAAHFPTEPSVDGLLAQYQLWALSITYRNRDGTTDNGGSGLFLVSTFIDNARGAAIGIGLPSLAHEIAARIAQTAAIHKDRDVLLRTDARATLLGRLIGPKLIVHEDGTLLV